MAVRAVTAVEASASLIAGHPGASLPGGRASWCATTWKSASFVCVCRPRKAHHHRPDLPPPLVHQEPAAWCRGDEQQAPASP
eukprot:scaffold211484_cov22-Tisochrysis_lutea.AAC.2